MKALRTQPLKLNRTENFVNFTIVNHVDSLSQEIFQINYFYHLK